MTTRKTITVEALAAALPHNLVAYGKHVEADELAAFIFAAITAEPADESTLADDEDSMREWARQAADAQEVADEVLETGHGTADLRGKPDRGSTRYPVVAALAPTLDAQTADLLAALAERDIHSRGDLVLLDVAAIFAALPAEPAGVGLREAADCAFVGTFMGQPQRCGEPPESAWHDETSEWFQHPYLPARAALPAAEPADEGLREALGQAIHAAKQVGGPWSPWVLAFIGAVSMYKWFDVGAGSRAHAFYVRKHDDIALTAACGVGPRQEPAELKPECKTCQRIVFRDAR